MNNTNYNDGNWHGWNNDADCPVNEKSVVEMIYRVECGFKSLTQEASGYMWEGCLHNPIVAFRVIEVYEEPREWDLIINEEGGAMAVIGKGESLYTGYFPGYAKRITVREVI